MSLGKQNLKATFPKEKTEIQVSFSTPALEGHKIAFHREEAAKRPVPWPLKQLFTILNN